MSIETRIAKLEAREDRRGQQSSHAKKELAEFLLTMASRITYDIDAENASPAEVAAAAMMQSRELRPEIARRVKHFASQSSPVGALFQGIQGAIS